MRTYVRTLPDFTTAVQSGNETTQKLVERIVYVSTSVENGPAMAGPAGPVPAPMLKLLSAWGNYFYGAYGSDHPLYKHQRSQT